MLTLSKLAKNILFALLAISGGTLIASGVDAVDLDKVFEIISGIIALVAALVKQFTKK